MKVFSKDYIKGYFSRNKKLILIALAILLIFFFMGVIVSNIGAGDKKQAKELISLSTSDRRVLRRTGLRVLTLLPKSVGMFVIRCYAKIPLYEYYLHNFVFGKKK